MISFWLLCWKLLRATAGLRRTTAELTDGNQDDSSSGNSNPANDSRTPLEVTDPASMEISPSPPLTDLERETLASWHDQEPEELHYPEVHEIQQSIIDKQEEEQAVEGENGETNGDECDYLVFETGEQKRGSEEGEESEGAKEEGKEGGGEEIGGAIGQDEGSGDVVAEDGCKGERESMAKDEEKVNPVCLNEKILENVGEDGESEDLKVSDGLEDETGGEVKADTLAEILFVSESPVPSSSQTPTAIPYASEQPAAAMLHEAWDQDLGNRDDLSDCLQAELAIVYSDSDAGEDQCVASMPCDVTSREEADGGIHDSICEEEEEEKEGKSEERGKEEDETEEQTEKAEGRKEEWRTSREDDDDEEQMRSQRDVFLRSPSVSSTTSSADPDRRVPVDFCVHQDTLSENVSTERVDFLLARQQWKKMEEEVRGQPIPKPGLKAQGSFQGTHTSLYPPTRSPRLKHREIHPPSPREPTLSSTVSPSSEDSGMDDSSYRCPLEEQETAVEREIRLTLEREERHRRERGMITQGLTISRPTTLQTGRSPPRPPACRTPTLSISPSPSSSSFLPRSVYHEMTANNVIILEPDCSSSRSRILSTAIGGLSDWPASLDAMPSANVIVVETSNLIIRSASEFCLSSAPVSVETQESTFSSNPFFKLRSLSSQSLVEQEIRMVRQREEEWRRQREEMWRRRREEEWKRGKERYDTILVSPGLNENISYNVPEVPDRCVSSPSSPSRTRKMERSSLSCDHKFPPSLLSVPRRQNAMAQRWEASLLANQKKE